MSKLSEYKRLNSRQASLVNVGGFRPTGDPVASHFGMEPLCLPDEQWPESNTAPMLFVCQLNLTTAPVIPDRLQDIRLITLFVDAAMTGFDEENGGNWCLRTYRSLERLAPSVRPANAPRAPRRGLECRWEACTDHPNYDDPEKVLPAGFDDSEVELENVARTKIGGYVTTVQSEPWWDTRSHPANPAYTFQIASEAKAGMVWGDEGLLHFARGTAAGSEDQWFLDWQMY
jgi:uncharacterized protein YwqG